MTEFHSTESNWGLGDYTFLSFVLDGECTRTPDGVLERNGNGVHTTPNGITYKGNWKNDKVSFKVT